MFPLTYILFSSKSLCFSVYGTFSKSTASHIMSLVNALLYPTIFLLLSAYSKISFQSSKVEKSLIQQEHNILPYLQKICKNSLLPNLEMLQFRKTVSGQICK